MNVARTIARRSLCSRDRVGAVIVDAHNRIVDTGYNGPPRHFIRDPLEHTDVIRDGPQKTCELWCTRGRNVRADVTLGAGFSSYDDCPSLHAEQNALMFSDRNLREGGTIYVSSGVCGTCAKLIANSGLATVVMLDRPGAEHRKTDEWCEFMERCGITVITYGEEAFT